MSGAQHTPKAGSRKLALKPRQVGHLRAGFAEAVQINTDNAILRRNRLNLLHRIRATCAQVADLTRREG